MAIGLFILASGIVAMIYPRAMEIPHPSGLGTRLGGSWRGGRVTVHTITREQCVYYGALVACIGLAVIWNASIRRLDVQRKDRAIAESILLVRKGLEERYGRMENCTRGQVDATADELRVATTKRPYLWAAFLGRVELETLRKKEPKLGWDEVEARIERIFLELPCDELNREHFHESWGASNEL